MNGIPNTPESFWARVPAGDGCRPYIGAKTAGGYGLVGWNGGLVYAHRLAYQLTMGPVPAGLRVLHRCDNPPCCNPDHLWLGTAADNSQDMAAKGRMAQQKDLDKIARGLRHGRFTKPERTARGERHGMWIDGRRVRP